MKTPICPTCGCSLVRLGIGKENAVAYVYESREYLFCCQGCLQQFISEPSRYLRETSDLIVCPVCLGEKPLRSALTIEFAGEEFHFCRCPHCIEEFKKNPEVHRAIVMLIENLRCEMGGRLLDSNPNFSWLPE